jgi:DGQHR domain-containing protein
MRPKMSSSSSQKVPALIVHQWLEEWDEVNFAVPDFRRKPEPRFYIFSLPAHKLRRLSGIYPRQTDKPRAKDTAIQRAHDPKRSAEITRFVHGGFPWADLSDKQKQSDEFRDLRMPGWLPTAIIANILPTDAQKGSVCINKEDAIEIRLLDELTAELILPEGLNNNDWQPDVPPIEIIDGQHRLRAFDDQKALSGSYDLPVVGFFNLDVTWQAYLFYTINIKPKKINASLAFDLYPILRIQDWLERSPLGPAIYRETRAQELTEVLWSHPESPWHNRINMLGERGGSSVSQAAFIRSLMASYVKKMEGKGVSIGGLFGAELHRDQSDVLRWTRPQQAGFLILVWQTLANAIASSKERWAESLRQIPGDVQNRDSNEGVSDLAFIGKYSLLATDQGVRGIMQVTNDMCYVGADKLELEKWEWEEALEEDTISVASVAQALRELREHPAVPFLESIVREVSKFDWRTSSTPGLTEPERQAQLVFRGSSGYKEIRRQLLQRLTESKDVSTHSIAAEVIKRLRY